MKPKKTHDQFFAITNYAINESPCYNMRHAYSAVIINREYPETNIAAKIKNETLFGL